MFVWIKQHLNNDLAGSLVLYKQLTNDKVPGNSYLKKSLMSGGSECKVVHSMQTTFFDLSTREMEKKPLIPSFLNQ